MRVSWVAALLVMGAAGCTHISKYTGQPMVVFKEDALRELAAHDFRCDPAALYVQRLGSKNEAEVTGCGWRAPYTRLLIDWLPGKAVMVWPLR